MSLTSTVAGLPPDLDLDGGCIIELTAIDATTGADVTDVNVSQVMITARNLSGLATALESGAFFLVPGTGSSVGP